MPKKQKKKKGFLRKFIALLLVLVLLGGGSYGFYYFQLRPTGDGTRIVEFDIEQGENFNQVVHNLKKEKLIRSELVTKFYAKLTNHSEYYAGQFHLNDGMSTPKILNHIKKVENAGKNQVKVVVPEGTWAKDIAANISKQCPGLKTETIIKKWNDSKYLKELSKDYEFLNYDDLNNSQYKVKLEGYLFPDTYYVEENADIDTITRAMLDRFADVYDEYKEDIKESGRSVQEILTLASVVQFESARPDQMKKIAGVFYNRLNEDMKLESSVTVCYALYDKFNNPTDCEIQTGVDSPYNTYMNKGLPVGPILNPGQEAIDAVLHPEEHDYLYFVADINGDGTIYYSHTLEEHEEKMKELNLVLE